MKNKTELTDILHSPLLQIGLVTRYSGQYLVRPETVAEHTTQVGLLSYLIATKLKSLGESIDIGKVTTYALIHDIDESLTGDINRIVKYYTPVIRQELENIAVESLELLEHQLGIALTPDWRFAKTDGLEGVVVTLSDMLQVEKKVIEEVEFLGNKYMLKVAVEINGYLNKIQSHVEESKEHLFKKSTSKKYILNLIKQATELDNKICNKYKKDISELNISNFAYINGKSR